MGWIAHLPRDRGSEWDDDPRGASDIEIAHALIDHPHDERAAYWQVCGPSILESMLGAERAAIAMSPEAKGRLL